MLRIGIQLASAIETLEETDARLNTMGVFLRHVAHPRLAEALGAAYHEAGIGVRTGRLLESYTALTADEHVSEVGEDRIIVGSEVPYAIFVERLLPVAGRVAKNASLLNELMRDMERYVVDGRT